MAVLGNIDYRRAEPRDARALMWLHQQASEDVFNCPLLLDQKRLSQALASQQSVWIVAEREGVLLAALSILLEKENRIAKVDRVLIHPDWDESSTVLRRAMPLLIHYLGEKSVEVLYTTTRGMTLAQQELTLKMGFKQLGIFPNAVGIDQGRLNSVTAYFFPEVLTSRRSAEFVLHPDIGGIFEIVRQSCDLPDVPRLSGRPAPGGDFRALPELELIHAPALVAHRFSRLKERRFLSTSFYPFHTPNVLVTDPAQRIEIFARLDSDARFAAVIAERLDLPVNPSELYRHVSALFQTRNIGYVEILNDASDAEGMEYIMNAGFLPCAYFPCFHNAGEIRRDYVVFAKSFERLPQIPKFGQGEMSRTSRGFLEEYYRLDRERISSL